MLKLVIKYGIKFHFLFTKRNSKTNIHIENRFSCCVSFKKYTFYAREINQYLVCKNRLKR